MGKVLIVYYSRSGNTRKVAEALKSRLGCDIEEIKTEKSYAGAMGWITAGKEGSKKECAKILDGEKNPGDYDLVILGTPIWGWNMASPLRAYVTNNKDKFKKVSAYCTMGGSYGKCFEDIENVCGKKLEGKAAFIDKEIVAGKINEEEIKKLL